MNTDNILNGHYTLDGFTSTLIMYNKVSEEWRMELLAKRTTYFATTGRNDHEYPFGTRKWNISSPLFSGIMNLNLNGCNDNTQFNCEDGSCISIDNRWLRVLQTEVVGNYFDNDLTGAMGIMTAMMPLMSYTAARYQCWTLIWTKCQLLHSMEIN